MKSARYSQFGPGFQSGQSGKDLRTGPNSSPPSVRPGAKSPSDRGALELEIRLAERHSARANIPRCRGTSGMAGRVRRIAQRVGLLRRERGILRSDRAKLERRRTAMAHWHLPRGRDTGNLPGAGVFTALVPGNAASPHRRDRFPHRERSVRTLQLVRDASWNLASRRRGRKLRRRPAPAAPAFCWVRGNPSAEDDSESEKRFPQTFEWNLSSSALRETVFGEDSAPDEFMA
jgi:hypothetical protein